MNTTPNISADAVADLSLESTLAELELIVSQMESGNLALEQSVAAYTRGSALLKHCEQLLAQAEQQVHMLSDNQLHPFEARHE